MWPPSAVGAQLRQRPYSPRLLATLNEVDGDLRRTGDREKKAAAGLSRDGGVGDGRIEARQCQQNSGSRQETTLEGLFREQHLAAVGNSRMSQSPWGRCRRQSAARWVRDGERSMGRTPASNCQAAGADQRRRAQERSDLRAKVAAGGKPAIGMGGASRLEASGGAVTP